MNHDVSASQLEFHFNMNIGSNNNFSNTFPYFRESLGFRVWTDDQELPGFLGLSGLRETPGTDFLGRQV